MEITTAPHRPAATPWGRLLALVVVLTPVSVLVLLPIGLGLERFVMTGGSMAGDGPGGITRGSLVLERRVPVDDLHVGDVITFRAPAGSGVRGTVTHRIASIGPDGIRTRGDAETVADPWLLRPTAPLVSRVSYVVPGVGFAYLVLADWRLWAAVALGLLGLGSLVGGGRRHRTRRASSRSRHPAGSALDRGGRAPDDVPRLPAAVVPVTAGAGRGPAVGPKGRE